MNEEQKRSLKVSTEIINRSILILKDICLFQAAHNRELRKHLDSTVDSLDELQELVSDSKNTI